MAEFAFYRRHRTPTCQRPEHGHAAPFYHAADTLTFEVVLADDDARLLDDPTPRTTNLVRLFSRGDLSVLRHERTQEVLPRDVFITTARGASRTIRESARIGTAHIDLDLTPLGLTCAFPCLHGQSLGPFDHYLTAHPLGEADPVNGELFDTYRARPPKARESR